MRHAVGKVQELPPLLFEILVSNYIHDNLLYGAHCWIDLISQMQRPEQNDNFNLSDPT